MKKALTILAAVLLLATAGCGSDDGQQLSDQEQKVANAIAKELSASSGARLPEKDATCFAEKFVADAGVKALKKSKLIDADGNVQQSGAEFDKPLSEKYADAYLSCVDFSAQVAKTFAETDEGIDEEKLAQCLDEALPDSLVKKVIIDTRAPETANSKDVTEANQKVAECQQKAQKDTPEQAPKGEQKKDSKKK